nr:MAG TPA: hypothetical protein [Caudoviricetes sp.]
MLGKMVPLVADRGRRAKYLTFPQIPFALGSVL